MRKETKSKIIISIISIAIVILIISFGYKIIMGRDGVIRKYSYVESEFDKSEVLEKLNTLLKEKYMLAYNESKTIPDKNIEDLYNSDIAISYLIENNIIEYYYYSNFDENTKTYKYISNESNITNELKREDSFWVNVNNINEVQTYGKGQKYIENGEKNNKNVFILEKKQENDVIQYILNYYDNQANKEEIGVLKVNNPLE